MEDGAAEGDSRDSRLHDGWDVFCCDASNGNNGQLDVGILHLLHYVAITIKPQHRGKVFLRGREAEGPQPI